MAKIKYCGHSAVIITTEKNKNILVDPFLEGNSLCPEQLKNPEKVDFIILSHGHSDHVGSTLELAKKHQAIVVGTYELIMLLVKDGLNQNQIQPMNKGGTISLGNDLEITLTHAFHSSSYDALDGKTYYAGEACGIVLKLESGKNIYHAGDTAVFSDMELISKRFSPEVALLPTGDRFTMGPKDAALATKLINPKYVIPIHYATFAGYLLPDAKDFVAEIKRMELSSIPHVLSPGEEFNF